MGSKEFQKELISYLEDENNKLRNKVTNMKDILDKVLTRDSSKNILENTIEEFKNVCTLMTEEIDDLYEHFSATSAALCIVLKRKSQIIQLTKRVCELHSVEQIDPELELIEANNKASFARRLSGAKSDKRGTAKVSPMIKGHVILTAPRIHLNRVSQDASIRHRIVSETARLSPVVEVSPVTPSRNQRHLFSREIQIPLQRLNINSDGQVINRNNEESPRTTVIKRQPKVLATRVRNNEILSRNNEPSETTEPLEEENEERVGEEEKENLSGVSDVDRVSDTVREDDSQVCEDENIDEQCSPNSSTEKGDSPGETVDPLEGPSWLLDARPNRRGSVSRATSFNFVNVRRKRNHYFPVENPDAENQTSEPKLDPINEQQEADESEEKEEYNQDEKNNTLLDNSVNSISMEMTECLPVGNLNTSDMEMTECVRANIREIPNPANKSLASPQKLSSSVLESSSDLNSPGLRASESQLEPFERNCIVESSEEEEPTTLSSISTLINEKTTEDSTALLENSRDLKNTPELGTVELVLEKIDARMRVSSNTLPKHNSSKNSNSSNNNHNKNKSSPKPTAPEVENNDEAESPSLSNSYTRTEQPINVLLSPVYAGRPKRGAALRCMEQKVWIVESPESKKNKNQNQSKSSNHSNINNNNNNKSKRKQDNDEENSPAEKKQKKRLNSVKIKKEESDVDSESDSSQESSPSPSPQKRKNAKTKLQKEETRQSESLNNRQTASRPLNVDSKNKRKESTALTSVSETSRTVSESSINNSSVFEEEGRKRRKAAPGSLKEPNLNSKLRRNR